jgi:hypothetical protein
LYRLRKRPQTEDDALPHMRPLLVAGQGWSGIAISGTAAGGGRRGPGLPGCTGTPHEAPPPEGLAVTLALRRLPAGQREAIVLTFCLDLSPELAAAAMRVSLATLRRRLAEARSALRAVLPSNL